MDTAAATALAPRVAGRLTPELILSSPQYMNCVGKYEIDFRGNKLGAIENLGATENQFDSMDFTDNAIVFLDGFPKLKRLKVLLMNNNAISRIGQSLEDRIPNLEMLVLTNNKIEALQSPGQSSHQTTELPVDPIHENATVEIVFSQYVVHLLPKLTVLDFTKIKVQEQPSMDVDHEAKTTVGRVGASKSSKKTGPTPEQITAIKAAIQNAATLEEVRQLEAALKSGIMPAELQSFQPSRSDAEETATGEEDVEMAETE